MERHASEHGPLLTCGRLGAETPKRPKCPHAAGSATAGSGALPAVTGSPEPHLAGAGVGILVTATLITRLG